MRYVIWDELTTLTKHQFRFLETKVHIKYGEYSVYTKIYRIYREICILYICLTLKCQLLNFKNHNYSFIQVHNPDINPF